MEVLGLFHLLREGGWGPTQERSELGQVAFTILPFILEHHLIKILNVHFLDDVLQ